MHITITKVIYRAILVSLMLKTKYNFTKIVFFISIVIEKLILLTFSFFSY